MSTGSIEEQPRAGERSGAELIDRDSFIPYYVQLKEILCARLDTEWPAQARLPGEPALCAQYQLSRTVVRQALNELEAEGRVIRRKGRGTFAAPPKVDEILCESLTGLHGEMTARGSTVRSHVRHLEVVRANAEVAGQLGLIVDEPVIWIERLRFMDDEPWSLVTTYIPEGVAPGLPDEDLSGSLYTLLEQKYKIKLQYGRRLLEAVKATRPVAEALACRPGDPMLLLRSAAWDMAGRPVEYFLAYHRGDRSRFEAYVHRGSGGRLAWEHR